MPKASLGVDYSGVKPAEGYSSYSGEVPPRGVYRCKTGLFRLVTNGSGDPMFKIVFEINEPKASKKSKYNGYAIWHNANIGEKSAPYTNAMFAALGISTSNTKGLYGKGQIVLSQKNEEDVVKIGGVTVRGIEVIVTTKRREYQGEPQLSAQSFSPYDPESGDNGADDSDDDEPDTTSDSDDDDDDSDSDDDDDDSDDDDEDAF